MCAAKGKKPSAVVSAAFMAAVLAILLTLPASASLPRIERNPLAALAPPVDLEHLEAELLAIEAEAGESAATVALPRRTRHLQAPAAWPYTVATHPCARGAWQRIRTWNQPCVLGYPFANVWSLPKTRVWALEQLDESQHQANQTLSAETVLGAADYLFDALGSVVDITSDVGTLLAMYQYDAWGNTRNEAGSSANRFGFTGHEHDDETGLIYAKARFYDPQLGRFLSHDPVDGDLTNPPSLHRYLYAFQNPTVFVDPDGRMPDEAQEAPENLDDLITAEADVVRSGEEIPEGFIVVKAGVGDSLFILPSARLEELGIAVPDLGGKEGPSLFERAGQSLKDLSEKVASFFVDPLAEKARTFDQQFDEATANRKDSSIESLAQGDQERVNQAKLTVEAAGELGVEAVNTGSNVAGAAGGGKLIVGAAMEAAERQAKKRGARAAGRAAASAADEAANPILGRKRVGSALKEDQVRPLRNEKGQIVREFPATPREHGFPDLVDNFAGDAQRFSIPTRGPGGRVVRESELFQVEGSQHGQEGVFEWIVDQGRVTHRRFISGGKVTGTPNQAPGVR